MSSSRRHPESPTRTVPARTVSVRAVSTDPTALWIAGVMRAVARQLRRRPDADDVAMRVVLAVLEQPAARQRQIMARYPDPVAYARMVARHALIDHDRCERVQQCRGARLFRRADGTIEPGRTWHYGDAPVQSGGESMFDLWAADDAPVDEFVAEHLDALGMLQRVLGGLSADERDLLHRIDGLHHRVSDIAHERGVARETLSKKVSSARLRVQTNRREVENGGMVAKHATRPARPAAAGAAHVARRR
ncbi:MAG: hypothetical protein RJB61_685 [Actinomycetota bacterium]